MLPPRAPGRRSRLVVADAAGPYSIAEGDDLALDASATTAGPAAVYEWDLDGDGAFDDATGPNAGTDARPTRPARPGRRTEPDP